MTIDFLGNELKIGDKVVYATEGKWPRVNLKLYEIVGFNATGPIGQTKIEGTYYSHDGHGKWERKYTKPYFRKYTLDVKRVIKVAQ